MVTYSTWLSFFWRVRKTDFLLLVNELQKATSSLRAGHFLFMFCFPCSIGKSFFISMHACIGKEKREDQPRLLSFFFERARSSVIACARLTWAYIFGLAVDNGVGRTTHLGLFWFWAFFLINAL